MHLLSMPHEAVKAAITHHNQNWQLTHNTLMAQMEELLYAQGIGFVLLHFM